MIEVIAKFKNITFSVNGTSLPRTKKKFSDHIITKIKPNKRV